TDRNPASGSVPDTSAGARKRTRRSSGRMPRFGCWSDPSVVFLREATSQGTLLLDHGRAKRPRAPGLPVTGGDAEQVILGSWTALLTTSTAPCSSPSP